MTFWQLAGLWAILALPVVLLGLRSLAGLGPVRRWVALSVRLLLILFLLFILAGVRWERTNEDVEVIVVKDVSESTRLFTALPAETLGDSVDLWLSNVIEQDQQKRRADRVGMISFDGRAYVDAIPSEQLIPTARALREGGEGTNVAAALQLALATTSREARSRIVLIWDGNSTEGDLARALDLARSAGVPVDVMPLDYEAKNEIVVERFIAPSWRKENEPFTIEVILRSTNVVPVAGDLSVLHQNVPMDLDADQAGVQPQRRVTLSPGRNVVRVPVPALAEAGVHQFKAIFEPLVATGASTTNSASGSTTGSRRPGAGTGSGAAGDTLLANNTASAFTFVRGRGRVLYVDSESGRRSRFLIEALKREGIVVDETRLSVDQFPTSLAQLQDYEAIILHNIPRGQGGLSDEQGKMVAGYVHDMGGGLVMIGGEETFGAGGWQNSRLEEVLPVLMEIPAERQIPKGALALIMHSTEMPNGNYWGIQCGIKAIETLSPKDEVGVLSFTWRGGGGGTQWDYPLSEKGDGSRAIAGLKNMELGDMPDFDDAMRVALGEPGKYGLLDSDARNKHMIIISDGDPTPPAPEVLQKYIDNNISITTVAVYPHGMTEQTTMQRLADQTGGRMYGPIESNPSQLPQIFTKEAAVVRRSLIVEDREGIPVQPTDQPSDLTVGIDLSRLPPVFGMVLTRAKPVPEVVVPLVAGERSDPLFAHWQSGLGKSAIFASDAWNRWAANWVGSDAFGKFWAQVIRGVSRPGESGDLDVRIDTEGERGRIVVEAVGTDSRFRNFMTIRGSVVGPDLVPREVKLTQTQPGVYEAEFEAKQSGNYVVGLVHTAPDGSNGVVRSGTVVNASPELRQLRSDRFAINEVIERTGGRLLSPFDPTASLFTRDGLSVSRSPREVWDVLLPILITLLLLDIAIRRIAWDWRATRAAAERAATELKGIASGPRVESTGSVDALRDVRNRRATGTHVPPDRSMNQTPSTGPQSSRKFDAGAGVSGDTTDLLGGASGGKPAADASQSTTAEPRREGASTDGIGGLMEAKRRAQQKIREREEGK